MKTLVMLVAFIILQGICASQAVPTGKAVTKAQCSPATTGSHNNIVLNCTGIRAEQGKKILALLNTIVKNENSRSMNDKLDELLKIASQPTVIVQAEIAQSGLDCTQNIIAGNNNTNNCVPKPITITPAQGDIIARYLKQYPGLSGPVEITYEYGAEGGQDAATNLSGALKNAGIDSTISGGMIVGSCDPTHPLPGLSLNCVLSEHDPLANAIANALVKAGVIGKPVHANLGNRGNDPLSIVIRKP